MAKTVHNTEKATTDTGGGLTDDLSLNLSLVPTGMPHTENTPGEPAAAQASEPDSLTMPETERRRLPIEKLADLKDIRASVTFSDASIDVAFEAQHETKGEVSGSVYCRRSKTETLMIVESSQASGGGGPIAYDIAMEIATRLDLSLASDRGRVSDEAMKVWEYYRNNRPDVEAIELEIGDFYLGRRTEGPEFDSVTEDRATWPDKSHPIWSLWSGYQKQPDIISALERTGEIEINDLRG